MNPSDALCVSVEEAAARLGCSRWTVRAWVSSGVLPRFTPPSLDGTKTNRRILIRVEDLRAFVAKHTERAS